MKRFLLIVIFANIAFGVFAQERVVSGKVSSKEDGSPLPGVNVQVKGTTIGTATDGDGNYRLNVPAGADVLTFSFIGFKTVDEPIGSRSTIDVTLESDATQLSEVVVVGYGTQIKQDLTGLEADLALMHELIQKGDYLAAEVQAGTLKEKGAAVSGEIQSAIEKTRRKPRAHA